MKNYAGIGALTLTPWSSVEESLSSLRNMDRKITFHATFLLVRKMLHEKLFFNLYLSTDNIFFTGDHGVRDTSSNSGIILQCTHRRQTSTLLQPPTSPYYLANSITSQLSTYFKFNWLVTDYRVSEQP